MSTLSLSQAPTQPSRMRHALDPVSRSTELLFGLIMVLTFTASLNAAEAGRIEVRVMLIAALGCNLAWGLIDAVMYLLSTRGERALAARTLAEVRSARTPEAARSVIAGALPPVILPAMTADDLDRIRTHVVSLARYRPGPAAWQGRLPCRGGGLSSCLRRDASGRHSVRRFPRPPDRALDVACRRHRAAVPGRLVAGPSLGTGVAGGRIDDRGRPCPCGRGPCAGRVRPVKPPAATPQLRSAQDIEDNRVTDRVIRLAFLGMFAYWSIGLVLPFVGIAVWSVILAVALNPALRAACAGFSAGGAALPRRS